MLLVSIWVKELFEPAVFQRKASRTKQTKKCLSTFSHSAVQILASPTSIAGGAPKCKTREFNKHYQTHLINKLVYKKNQSGQ